MIIIIVDPDFMYGVIKDYICSMKFKHVILHKYVPNINYLHEITNNPNTIFIFVNNIFNIPLTNQKNVYVLNVEQLSIKCNFERIQNLPPMIQIIDYNYSNIILSSRKTMFLPYQYNDSEILDIPKTKEVVFIGLLNERRYNTLLKINCIVTYIQGIDLERDKILFGHKILVNIHYRDDYNVFEEIRCNRCIFNKMIVISEKSIHMENYRLKKYMIECSLDEIPDMVEKVLNDYDYYYTKLFLNYDLEIVEHKKYFEQCKREVFPDYTIFSDDL